ncbi:COMM domain-containing protein 1 isoform X5 [Sceloporus undulatus]|uniref:COMM domain-containing protein 1 isoform X5 n=1 Tax=Sceloporus undulatus TaxID=8520 RepID=UPI001C4B8971|nr:COMM domain-containing protein 1 isoform X5 [Sceloporus undulatus]
MAPQEFAALRAKAAGLLKSIASADMDTNQLEAFLTAQTKKPGGITSDQAAVIAKFWRNHRMKIRDNLINQSKWENSLKNLSWRVDFKSQSRNIDQLSSPVAIVEMELRKNGQARGGPLPATPRLYSARQQTTYSTWRRPYWDPEQALGARIRIRVFS